MTPHKIVIFLTEQSLSLNLTLEKASGVPKKTVAEAKLKISINRWKFMVFS
jgi:hypothetical protein